MVRLLAPAAPRDAAVLYWMSLVVPAAPALQRYFGWGALFGYALAMALLLPWLLRLRPQAWLSHRTLTVLTVAAVVVLTVMFVIIYPIADRGLAGGSDNDDAIDVGIVELMAGRFPYHASTYLGNYLGAMPGAFLLGYPFWLSLGKAAYQNIFQLVVFVGILRWLTRDSGLTLGTLVLTFALSLSFIHDFLTGSDRFANAIVVLTGIVATMHTCGRGRWPWLLSCVYLGIGLSWRIPFALAMPILFAGLVRRNGWKRAVGSMVVIGAVFVAVTAPFYLYDPASFTGLRGIGKLARYDEVIPFGSFAVLAIAIVGTGLLALAPSNRDDYGLLRNIAVCQMLMVLSAGALQAIATRGTEITYFSYGSFFTFFAVVAASLAIARERHSAGLGPAPRGIGGTDSRRRPAPNTKGS